jgi:hypothetical protein
MGIDEKRFEINRKVRKRIMLGLSELQSNLQRLNSIDQGKEAFEIFKVLTASSN